MDNHSSINKGWLRSLIFLVSYFVIGGLFTIPSTFIIARVANINDQNKFQQVLNLLEFPENVHYLLLSQFFQLIGTLTLIFIFYLFIDTASIKRLTEKFELMKDQFIIGFLLGVIVIGIAFLLLYEFELIDFRVVGFPMFYLASYVALFIIVAFIEEIIFRGYILENLCDSFNTGISIILSSLIFSFLHIFNANASILGLLNLILSGIFLGLVYKYYNNIWPVIGLHFSWNFFQGPILGFEVSGKKIASLIELDIISSNELLTGGGFGLEGSVLITILLILFILMISIMIWSYPIDRVAKMNKLIKNILVVVLTFASSRLILHNWDYLKSLIF